MANAAIVVLAGTESHADRGRIANALETAKEFAETEGDEVELIFDGAGTQWIPALEDEDSDLNPLYEPLKDHVSVCDFCAGAFDVSEAVDEAGLTRLADYDGHPSLRSYVADGYEILTF